MLRGALFPVKLKNWAPLNKIQYSIRKALNELSIARLQLIQNAGLLIYSQRDRNATWVAEYRKLINRFQSSFVNF